LMDKLIEEGKRNKKLSPLPWQNASDKCSMA
jgi:hypothetical protein